MQSCRRLLIVTQFRSNYQRQYTSRAAFRRNFSFTPRSQASEAEDPSALILDRYRDTKLYKQLKDKPEAFAALQSFMKLLQEHGASALPRSWWNLTSLRTTGVDIQSGKHLSTMQMIKLAANSEFRAGATLVAQELKRAGIDQVRTSYHACGRGHLCKKSRRQCRRSLVWAASSQRAANRCCMFLYLYFPGELFHVAFNMDNSSRTRTVSKIPPSCLRTIATRSRPIPALAWFTCMPWRNNSTP